MSNEELLNDLAVELKKCEQSLCFTIENAVKASKKIGVDSYIKAMESFLKTTEEGFNTLERLTRAQHFLKKLQDGKPYFYSSSD